MNAKRPLLLMAALLLACADSNPHQAGDAPETAETLGHAAAVDDGYTRYYSSVQTLEAGQSLNLVEWIAGALDQDMDVVNVKGGQTVGGHHVTLNSSTAVEKVGLVRPYTNSDQLTSTVVGAVGGEGTGNSATNFPDNYVFRVYKGQGLYLQTHYINLTGETIKVRSYVDVKLDKPSKDRKVLTLFGNSTLQNRLAPQAKTEQTVECVTQADLSLLMFTNHMHEYGTSIRTEAVLPDGKKLVIKDDPVWNVDWEVKPNYTRAFDQPVQLPKGTKLSTHCKWENTTSKELKFPDEMCVFVAFRASETGLGCTDGQWQTVDPHATTEANTSSKPITKLGDGACSGEDLSTLPTVRDTCQAKVKEDVAGCALPLLQGNSQCVVDCFEQNKVSTDCGQCYGDFIACNASKCATPCTSDPTGDACVSCQKSNCCSDFESCSGVSCG